MTDASGYEWHSCFLYLDDIFNASRTFDDHLHHLCEVFGHLHKAGLHLKPKKCCDKVSYLKLVSTEGIRPDPFKTEKKVKSFLTPTDTTSLVGLATYRRFVPGFAMIAESLHALRYVRFEWTPDCETAFSS